MGTADMSPNTRYALALAVITLLSTTAVATANTPQPTDAHDTPWLEELSLLHADADALWGALTEEFVDHYDNGQIKQALYTAQRAFTLSNNVFGMNHVNTADSLLKLGIATEALGEYPAAEAFFMGSLAILRENLAHAHPDTAVVLTNLGNIQFQLGKLQQSEQAHLEALSIRKQTLGSSHPSTAQSLYNLGVLYEHGGNSNEARGYYVQAAEMWSATLGPGHPYIATAYNNLGSVATARGELALASEYYAHALDINRNYFGPNHPEVARTLINLGASYAKSGQYAKASPFYREALAVAEEVLGPEHPQIGVLLYSLANVYRAQAVQPATLHPTAAARDTTVRRLATPPDADSDNRKTNTSYLTEAMPLYERAWAILDKNDNTNPALAATLMELSTLYLELGDNRKAATTQSRLAQLR